jgi:hypothetical protein
MSLFCCTKSAAIAVANTSCEDIEEAVLEEDSESIRRKLDHLERSSLHKANLCEAVLQDIERIAGIESLGSIGTRVATGFYKYEDSLRSDLTDRINSYICSYLNELNLVLSLVKTKNTSLYLKKRIEALKNPLKFNEFIQLGKRSYARLEASLTRSSMGYGISRSFLTDEVRFEDKKLFLHQKIFMAKNLALESLVHCKIAKIFQSVVSERGCALLFAELNELEDLEHDISVFIEESVEKSLSEVESIISPEGFPSNSRELARRSSGMNDKASHVYQLSGVFLEKSLKVKEFAFSRLERSSLESFDGI